MVGRIKATLRAAMLIVAATTLAALARPELALAQSAQGSQAIDSDLVKPGQPTYPSYPTYSSTPPPAAQTTYGQPTYGQPTYGQPYAPAAASAGAGYASGSSYDRPSYDSAAGAARAAQARDTTYREDDLIGAAEGVFGKGALGLAQIIQDILKKQGRPNGYITGREAGGAAIVGLRYGQGTLSHKIEGRRKVYWTGPSIGFDAGANAAKTFVLVYNLYNTDDLFHRFGAGEGQAYLVGGFNVSYVRRGNIVLIPVRMGVGLRLGLNGGYMKFSKKQRWFPL